MRTSLASRTSSRTIFESHASVSLASSIPVLGLERSVLGRAVLSLGFFCVLGLRALCPRLHLWYHVFINAIIVGVKVFLEVGIELEKRVKSVLLLCFVFFALLFSSIVLLDEGLGSKGGRGLAGPAPE